MKKFQTIKLYFVFVFILLLNNSLAQDTITRRIFSANMGFASIKMQSKQISPVRYEKICGSYNLTYNEITSNKYEFLNVLYSKTSLESSLTSSNGNPHIQIVNASINYYHFRKFKSVKNNQIDIYIGGCWNTNYLYRKHILSSGESYTPNKHRGGFSYLGFGGMVRCRIDNSREILYYTSLSVAGVKSYSYIDQGFKPEFTSVLELVDWQNILGYKQALSAKFDFFLKYNFSFFNYSEHENIKIGKEYFVLGIGVHFYEK